MHFVRDSLPRPSDRADNVSPPNAVRVVALGSAMASDDGAALRAAEALRADARTEVICAGRPGPSLLDLLEASTPTLLLDVVRHGVEPGRIVSLPLDALINTVVGQDPVSSHGLGVAEALRLGEALGRSMPPGRFVGLGGARFGPGIELSPAVSENMAAYVAAARLAVRELLG